MSAVWDPNRWWDWCMSEDEKKEIGAMFIEELSKYVSVVYDMGVLKHFESKIFINLDYNFMLN